MDWIKNEKRCTTMYSRNYGGFDYVRIPAFAGRQALGIANASSKPKNINFNPVTDGYTNRCS